MPVDSSAVLSQAPETTQTGPTTANNTRTAITTSSGFRHAEHARHWAEHQDVTRKVARFKLTACLLLHKREASRQMPQLCMLSRSMCLWLATAGVRFKQSRYLARHQADRSHEIGRFLGCRDARASARLRRLRAVTAHTTTHVDTRLSSCRLPVPPCHRLRVRLSARQHAVRSPCPCARALRQGARACATCLARRCSRRDGGEDRVQAVVATGAGRQHALAHLWRIHGRTSPQGAGAALRVEPLSMCW